MFNVQCLISKISGHQSFSIGAIYKRILGAISPLKRCTELAEVGARGMFSGGKKPKDVRNLKAGNFLLTIQKYRRTYALLLVSSVLFLSCKENPSEKKVIQESTIKAVEVIDTVPKEKIVSKKTFRTFENLADTTFVRLADFSDGFAYDLRYATENNFLKEKVYDCAECYTRVKTVKALLAANANFKKEGVRIKFYDCYRPNSVQYKMWAIVPNPQYVANPKKGSIHNKGGAVDITLETLEGQELDMGTDFDFFGKRAYHDNFDLPQEILDNRKLLKETMEKHGFWSTRTEWWHYNLSGAAKDKIANFKWKCD